MKFSSIAILGATALAGLPGLSSALPAANDIVDSSNPIPVHDNTVGVLGDNSSLDILNEPEPDGLWPCHWPDFDPRKNKLIIRNLYFDPWPIVRGATMTFTFDATLKAQLQPGAVLGIRIQSSPRPHPVTLTTLYFPFCKGIEGGLDCDRSIEPGEIKFRASDFIPTGVPKWQYQFQFMAFEDKEAKNQLSCGQVNVSWFADPPPVAPLLGAANS